MPANVEPGSPGEPASNPGPMAARPGVLVLGMHRSGTSAVTQAVHHLGLDAGPDQVGGDWSNPNGHWESQRLLAVNDALLARGGATWRSIPEGFAVPTHQDAVDQAALMILSRYAGDAGAR